MAGIFERAFLPAFNQSAANFSQQQETLMRDKLLQDRQKAEELRAYLQSVQSMGIQPIYGSDGQIDRVATGAAVNKQRTMQEVLEAEARARAAGRVGLEMRGAELGVQRGQPAPAQPDFAAGTTGYTAPTDGGEQDYARRVAEAERAAKMKAVADESRVRAEAGAPFRERFTSRGPYMAGGKFIGDAVRDQVTGEIGIMQSGKLTPLPENAEPITATGMQKSIPNYNEFRKIRGELTDAEISLRNMDRYIQSVGDANVGLSRLADQFTVGIKTLLGNGQLDPKEVAARLAQGQLQGLLGANRTNVVGGGVMTEQDALRIIQRLGGDFNALQNPEVVRQAIAQVYSDRYKQYGDDYLFYNAAVDDYYGARGFPKADRVPYSAQFSTDGAAPLSAPAQAAPAAQPATLTPEEQRRLQELRAKLRQG